MINPSDYFMCDLVNLGSIDPRLASIYAPEPELGGQKIGITAQFLENAHVYQQGHFQFAHFNRLIRQTLHKIGFDISKGVSVLDIGSGFGNTVIPMAEIFDEAVIIATDLSENLLSMLGGHAAKICPDARIGAVCVDATRDYIRPEAFDIVVGSYILHHIIDPKDVIAAAFRALKPGGVAVWFEPFEAGFAVLRTIFEDLMAAHDSGREGMSKELREFLWRQVRDWKTRSQPDKPIDLLRRLDDKHLFTRHYFVSAAKAVGFPGAEVFALRGPGPVFRDMVNGLLGLNPLSNDTLPDWAWERVDYWDTILSPDLQMDLIFQGTIIMRKA